MADKKHTEYEQFVQGLYQALHDADGVKTVTVKHDVRLRARSGCRYQIDVYWEFEKAGELHRVAVECKHYREKVEIGKVRDFFGVLCDLGDVKGIFVTTVGYDKGAIEFANAQGITLKEARTPTPQDWLGRVKDVVATVTDYAVRVTNCRVNLDNGWLVENGKTKADELLSLSLCGSSDEICVYDARGILITSLLELVQRLPRDFKEEQQLVHRYDFADGYFLVPSIGKAKLNFVEFTYDVAAVSLTAVIAGEEVAKAIIKDVRTGAIKFFDRRGGAI